MATLISTFTEVVLADTRNRSGTILLPSISQIPYRILNFKDVYGTFGNSTLTLSTSLGNTFEDGTSTISLSNNYSFFSLYGASTKWVLLNGTQTLIQTISTLNVNSLNIGSGIGWIQMGPIQTLAVSTTQINTQNLYANCNYFGSVSSQTALQFYGLQGNYNNTVIAEQSTGTGLQELLFYKASSAGDQVRIQTTGSIVFESGVGSRLWPSYAQVSTPAMIINSSMNVGIFVSSPQTTLDVGGTGRFQLLSTLQLNVSSITGLSVVQTTNLTSTTIGLGTLQYISSAQLLSTTGGLQSALVSTATGLIDIPELRSTTIGLGTLQYISSAQLLSTTGSLQSALVSTTGGLIEIPELTSTTIGLGTLQYISSAQLVSTTGGLQSALVSTATSLIDIPELRSTTIGLGSLQYISSSQLLSTTTGLQSALVSTTTGLVRIPELTSTTIGLGTLQYISSAQLVSTTAGILALTGGNLPTALTSTTIGLGTLQYISSAQLLSTTAGLERYISSFIDPQELASSVLQFVSTGFFTKQMTSTTIGLGTLQYISSAQLVSTTAGILALTGGNLPTALTSTTIGLGTLQYISSAQLVSTTTGLQSALVSTATGLIDIPELRSTTIGLGTLQYISSAQLLSTTAGLERYISSFIDPQELASSVLQFVSTGFFTNQMTSTTIGLGTLQYISSAQLVSTTAGILALTGGNLPTALTSTTIGLGTLQYVSSSQLLSTTGGLQSALVSTATGLIDIPELRSTTIGLGTLQYISSAQLLSTTSSYARSFTTTIVNTCTMNTSSILFGIGDGYLSMPDIQPLTVSTLLLNVSTINGSAVFTSVNLYSTIQGLGSAQYISSAQLVSTTAGILALTGGNLPTALTSTTIGLGTLRYISSAQLLSTTAGLERYISSFIDPQELASSVLQFVSTGFFTNQMTSTTIGLGTLQYISSAQLVSTTGGLQSALVSTATGLIDIPELRSTTIGLGTLQYISSAQLLSTTAGLERYISSFIDPQELASSVLQFVSTGFFTNQMTSTTIGLGTLQYISSAQLLSTTAGLERYISSFIDPQELASSVLQFVSTGFFTRQLNSTTIGLGTLQYISSAQLLSTTGGLQSALVSTTTALVRIPELTSTTIGLGSIQYISSAQLLSTTAGLERYISSFIDPQELASSVLQFVSTGFFTRQLNSTTIGLASIGYVSTSQLISTSQGLETSITTNLQNIFDNVITSTTKGLGTLQYISSAQLLSTTAGLEKYISSFIDPQELASSVLQFVSTGFFTRQLNSTTIGLGSIQYISSSQLVSSVTGLDNEINSFTQSFIAFVNETNISTTIGLGTLQYISSAQLLSTTAGLERYISSFIDPQELASSVLQFVSTGFFTNQMTSTTIGLGSLQYISSSQLVSTTTGILALTGGNLPTALTSTTIGLGTLQYISSAQLLSTTAGLERYISSFIDPQELASSVLQFVSTGFFTNQITSTTIGLGTLQYISSAQLLSTTAGLERYISSFIDPQELASSVLQFVSTGFFTRQLNSTTIGLATIGYVSTSQLTSTSQGLETSITTNLQNVFDSVITSTAIGLGSLQYISSTQLLSTTAGLEKYISSFIDPQELASSVLQFVSTGFFTNQLTSTTIGLGSLEYVSSSQLISSVGSLQGQIDVFPKQFTSFLNETITSTTIGLGTIEYVSSAQLLSTTGGLQSETITNIVSSIQGLGSVGYVSTSQLLSTTGSLIGQIQVAAASVTAEQLASTTKGLGTLQYISSAQLLSTTAGLERYISSFIDPVELASSVLQFVSTGFFTKQMTSTTIGLGTLQYISTPQLVSTTAGVTSNYSTFLSTTLATYAFPYSGEMLFLNYSVSVSPYQQLGINNIIGPSQSLASSVPSNSSNNFLVGFQSDFYLPTFIPTGLWITSIFAQADTLGTTIYASLFQRTPGGTETLIATSIDSPFIVPITKVSLDLIIDLPYTTITAGNTIVLKIFGNNTTNQSRTITTFYEDGNYSHVNTTLGPGAIAITTFTSSIIGLGTFGYISTSQLVSTTAGILTSNVITLNSTTIGLGTLGYISSSQLVSTATGLTNLVGTFIDVPELTSTTIGLGTLQYISSAQLLSTTQGLQTYISSFIDPVELASSVLQFVSTGFFTNQLISTVKGLGSANYISTLSNVPYISAQSILASSLGINCNYPYFNLDVFGTARASLFLSTPELYSSSFRGNLGDAQTVILWEV